MKSHSGRMVTVYMGLTACVVFGLIKGYYLLSLPGGVAVHSKSFTVGFSILYGLGMSILAFIIGIFFYKGSLEDRIFFELLINGKGGAEKKDVDHTLAALPGVWDGGFDPEDPTYPRELDIAMQAWRAARSGEQVGQVRERAEKWLRSTYPDLPEAAVTRISAVINWNKVGGRPKSIA